MANRLSNLRIVSYLCAISFSCGLIPYGITKYNTREKEPVKQELVVIKPEVKKVEPVPIVKKETKTQKHYSSLTDYLDDLGQPSDIKFRTKLAEKYTIKSYSGTSQQNIDLLNRLISNPNENFSFVKVQVVKKPIAVDNRSRQEKSKDLLKNMDELKGTREEGGNNRGTLVTRFLDGAGIYTPSPWCGAYVNEVFKLSNIKHGVSSPAWSPSWSNEKRIFYKKDIMGKDNNFKGGDVFTLYYSSLGRVGHVGFIKENLSDKSVLTSEGNTSAAGTRETNTGRDGVFEKIRRKSELYTVGDFIL